MKPRYLYRYMSMACGREEWVRETVVESKLFFASRIQSNDPMDSTANVILDSDRAQREAIVRRIRSKRTAIIDPRREVAQFATADWFDDTRVTESMRQRWRRSVDRLGMVSLSSKSTNVLLWSHYAEKHQGICLKFRTDVAGDPFFGTARQIRYRPEFPTFRSLSDDHDEQIEALLLTKGSAWRYEGEWRLINTKRRGHDAFDPTCLVAVIFGWRMPARQRRKVLDWVEARGSRIQAYRCDPSPTNGYRLQVSRIT